MYTGLLNSGSNIWKMFFPSQAKVRDWSEFGWMDGLQFYVLFNSISVISG